MRKRRAAEPGSGSDGMFISRANSRGRRLFIRRQSRWAKLALWVAGIVAAACLLVGFAANQDPFGVVASGCLAVVVIAIASALIMRVVAGTR